VHLPGYMDRVLTCLFSVYGLYSFAYSGDQLCVGVHCSWECFYRIFLAVAPFFFSDKVGYIYMPMESVSQL
jgi:hypothetical protein